MIAQTGTLDGFLDFKFSGSSAFRFRKVDSLIPRFNAPPATSQSGTRSSLGDVAIEYRPVTEQDSAKVVLLSSPQDFEFMNLRARLFTLSLPQRLADEGIAAPTAHCRAMAADFAVSLYEEHHVFPERIAPNVEEGITLVYVNHVADKSLAVEVYNTTEVAALLNHQQTILEANDVRSTNDPVLHRMVQAFKKD